MCLVTNILLRGSQQIIYDYPTDLKVNEIKTSQTHLPRLDPQKSLT